ncbi:hypothetical protein ASD65_04220 [Microbacterium sp. Root61]|uniref:AAA family ATPase n=1 Tax=Microbacterium sp. Root61 TaxID=1736570 RepID=UPI0006F88C7E|nr:AAA family ATPase [Microbacterium sp. Root61]KRA23721.1 hypothetical protein ASD65_04220 [Microbacterium sp. Root61]
MPTVVELSSILPEELNYPLPYLPYRDAWEHYADAGLCPVPVNAEPPAGFQKWSRAKAERWAGDGDRWAYARTALFVPDGFVVLDDDYANPVRDLETALGTRGATLYSTSRGAGAPRRKSLYRVPSGSRFGGDYRTATGDRAGDIVDQHHRFMFVAPTINGRTGELEQWYSPEDAPLERFPTAQDIAEMVAELPEPWVEYLSSNARASSAERPYDGPTRFESGELSPRVLAVSERHPDTSRHPDANAALMSLAWVAVRFPESEGIETLRAQISNAYIMRTDTRTSVAERQARMDRAWSSALGTQAAKHTDEWAELEDEFGAVSVDWYRKHTATTPVSDLARLEALTPEQAEAEFGWDWESRLPQAQMRAEAIERAQDAQQAHPSAAFGIPAPECASWAPRDLSDVMADDYEPPKPTVFRRTDGMGLFYPGTVNEFHAVGGTGKTLAALAVCAEALRDGQTVLYVDYEEHPGRIVQRLRNYGIPDDVIRSRFLYVKPTEMPTSEALESLMQRSPSVVIIDTFAESFNNLTGGDSHRTDDVTAWFKLPRHFADAGACVIVTDHIPKDAQNKLMPIGSQAKHSGYKGAIYYLDAPTGSGLVKDGHGRLRFILGKDNGGDIGVRAGECAATFYLDATGEVSTWTLQAPDTGAILAEAAAAHTAERERIALALTDGGGSLPSRAKLWDALGLGKNSTPGALAALTDMIEDGSVIEEAGVGNAKSLRLISNLAPTPEADAERAIWDGFTTRPDVVPTSPVPVPGDEEDITSDIPVSLGTSLGISNAPRSPFTGVTDAELTALLDDDETTTTEPDPEPDTTKKGK